MFSKNEKCSHDAQVLLSKETNPNDRKQIQEMSGSFMSACIYGDISKALRLSDGLNKNAILTGMELGVFRYER